MTVLTVTAAGVRNRRRWLFEDLSVTASAGDIVAIVGPPGSGRTTVLLSLAQRFRLSAGRVEVAGKAALGYVPGVSEPEPVLTVAEHVRERALLAGRRRPGGVALHGLDPEVRGLALSPYQKQVLGIVLAQMSQPQIIGLDAVDEGLDAGEREALWTRIGEMAAAGATVLVTAREVDEARVSTVIRLGETGREAHPSTSDVDSGDAAGVPDRESAAVPGGDSAAAVREDGAAALPAAPPAAFTAAGPAVSLAAGPAVSLAAGPVAEPAVGPAALLAAGPAVGPAAEVAAAPVASAAADSAASPVAEPAAESAASPVVEPVASPAAEPAVSAAADSAASPAAEPAVEVAAEPLVAAVKGSGSTESGGENK
ncbi:ATP-binding cassette domain-containing protein [Actinoplanes sp. NPDC049316]|uniref:ABC transporter ATP-binding protein n=1 Tax=Actinoplanes sp. NPDC049316 TaxID=3154727 RepID=UPI0034123AEF